MHRLIARLIGCAFLANTAAAALPSRDDVLAHATRANTYLQNHTGRGDHACGWTRGTYMTGLMELWRATNDTALLDYAFTWAEANNWQLCSKREKVWAESENYPPGPKPVKPKGKDDADNMICGATYAELYLADAARAGGRARALGDLGATIDRQVRGVAAGITNLWSWIDAIHMGLNAYTRFAVATASTDELLNSATANATVLNAAFALYNTTANAGNPPDGVNTFHMWDEGAGLFYRDDRYLGTDTFWGRGNGWAIAALARTLEVLPVGAAFGAVRAEFEAKLVALARSLKALQNPVDGCWRADLHNASAFPEPEMTGTANFVFGIAFGIQSGLLAAEEFMPVLEAGYGCLVGVALQPSGLFGYCQPIGGSPAACNATTTSDFCVGQFLLASTAVAKVVAKVPAA